MYFGESLSVADGNSHSRNRLPSSDQIISGDVPDFVRRWIEFVLGDLHRRSNDVAKDWQLLEKLSSGEFEAYSKRSDSNVISFKFNRKTRPNSSSNQHIVRMINRLVNKYCIDSELTLPGFYAFLREITALQEQFPDAFK